MPPINSYEQVYPQPIDRYSFVSLHNFTGLFTHWKAIKYINAGANTERRCHHLGTGKLPQSTEGRPNSWQEVVKI